MVRGTCSRAVCTHAYTHVYTHVYSHVYTQVYVPFGADQRPTGEYEDFIWGFYDAATQSTWGRPSYPLDAGDGTWLHYFSWLRYDLPAAK